MQTSQTPAVRMAVAYPTLIARIATRTQQRLRQHGFLISCLAIILCVSAIDTLLVIMFRDTILFGEQNPICKQLIAGDPETLRYFLLGKGLGNLGVTTTLVLLTKFNYRHHRMVTATVTGFQLLLSVYLAISDPCTGLLHFDVHWLNREDWIGACRWILMNVALLAMLGGMALLGNRALQSAFNTGCGNSLNEGALR